MRSRWPIVARLAAAPLVVAPLAVALLGAAAAGCGTAEEPARSPGRDSVREGVVRPADRESVGDDPPVDPAPPGAGDDTLRFVPLDATGAGVWTAGIVRVQPEGGRATSILRSVRVARHEGYDRAVWEFSDARPGVHVEYVDDPVRACGSGHPVELAGDGWLEVRFEPAAAHDEAGRSTFDERRLEPALPVVLEVVSTCDFEAVVTWVLAVASPEPYRVTLLEGPPRVAVDVRHREVPADR